MTDTFKKQLKSVISAYEDDISDFSSTQITELHTRCVAAIERFFSLLKRGIVGIYHFVGEKHIGVYI